MRTQRRSHRPRRRRNLKGRGKFMDLLKKGHSFLKKTRAVSKVASALNSAGIAPKYSGTVAQVAGQLGYGRRRHKSHRTRRMHGRGKFMDFLNKANNWLKKTKVISTVANALGPVVPYASTVGNVAGKLGYGRKRRRGHRRATGSGRRHTVRHHRMRGRGIGHVYTPQSGIGIAGTATYSVGRVQF